MSASDRLRIGDQERESATAALGEHYSTGRLTRDELEERSRLALEARTMADLRPLFADVPLPHGPLQTARTSPTWAAAPSPGVWATPARRRGGPRFPWGPVVVALVALTVITDLPWIWFGLLAWAVWAMLSRSRRDERRARRDARRDAWLSSWLSSWHSSWNGSWNGSWHDGGKGSWSNSWSGACGQGGAHTHESRGSWSHRS